MFCCLCAVFYVVKNKKLCLLYLKLITVHNCVHNEIYFFIFLFFVTFLPAFRDGNSGTESTIECVLFTRAFLFEKLLPKNVCIKCTIFADCEVSLKRKSRKLKLIYFSFFFLRKIVLSFLTG